MKIIKFFDLPLGMKGQSISIPKSRAANLGPGSETKDNRVLTHLDINISTCRTYNFK